MAQEVPNLSWLQFLQVGEWLVGMDGRAAWLRVFLWYAWHGKVRIVDLRNAMYDQWECRSWAA